MTSSDREDGGIILPVMSPRPEDAGYDSGGKSPQQIEGDITETRAQLGEILDELERKLAPRHLLERGVDMLKDTMSGEGGGIGETVRNHPVPLALIGIGVGWMLMSATGRGARLGEVGGALRERVSGVARGAAGRVGDLAGQVREKVSGMTSGSSSTADSLEAPYPTEYADYAYARQKSGSAMAKARDTAAAAGGAIQDTVSRARETGAAAWQRAGDYAGQAGDQLYEARDRFTQLIEEHPLAVGALGFLAGSAIAFMLPRTETEDRFIGPAGDQLRDQAASLGREAVERAQHVAERTVDAAVGAVKDAVAEASDAASGKTGDPTPKSQGSATVGQGSPTVGTGGKI